MLNSAISLLLSIIISFAGVFGGVFGSLVDTFYGKIYEIPDIRQAIKDDFFGEIGKADIGFIDGETGYVKNTLAVFLDGDMTFKEKAKVLSSCGGVVIGWCTPIELYVIKTLNMSHGQAVAASEKLDAIDGVAYAMPLYLSKVAEQTTPDDPFDYEIENDGYFVENPVVWNELNPSGRNWWLEAVGARQAWDYEAYYQPVSLGVLDSGFDLEHPELEGKISFPNEKRANKNRPSDHGCHVAGIIAAERDNSTGIAGLCDHADLICVDWNPDPYSLQFWFTDIAIYYGFAELVQSGAKVINMSLGISASLSAGRAGFFDRAVKPIAMSLSMASLLDKGYDFVVVQSAGNGNKYGEPIDSSNNGHFTSVTPYNVYTGKYDIPKEEILGRIITVSAAANNGFGEYVQASYSNVGPYIDIAAPGSMVYSCGDPAVDEYGYKSGTSMAAPCVTGVAGLVWSINPGFTGKEVKEILVTSTDSVAKVNTDVEYYYGVKTMDYPMVNAKLAVEEAIRRTDSTVGTVSGRLNLKTADTVEFCGVEYTVLADGSFSFVAKEGSAVAVVKNATGEEIGSFELTVTAGETLNLSKIII